MNNDVQGNRREEAAPLINQNNRGNQQMRKFTINTQNKARTIMVDQNQQQLNNFRRDIVVQAGYDRFVITEDDIISMD